MQSIHVTALTKHRRTTRICSRHYPNLASKVHAKPGKTKASSGPKSPVHVKSKEENKRIRERHEMKKSQSSLIGSEDKRNLRMK